MVQVVSPMGDIWLGPWSIYPHYMDPTFGNYNFISQGVQCVCKNLKSDLKIFIPDNNTEVFNRFLIFLYFGWSHRSPGEPG